MAHNPSKNNSSSVAAAADADEVKASGTIFHDFLGKGSAPDYSSPVVGPPAGKVRPTSEASPSSASFSIGASSGGGRGQISTTSDLGSERQAGNHFEGVPFYGARNDLIGLETNSRFAGTKRSNSDSYVGTSKDRFPPVRSDSLEGSQSQLMKLMRHAGGERPRRSHDEDASFPMHLTRPISASLVSQPPSGARAGSNTSRLDRGIPMNVGPPWQYPPRSSQVVPFGYQALSNKFRDTNVGPSVISQGAADEGSRTGIKGSGLFSAVNTIGGLSERNCAGAIVSNSKPKSGIHISEPESSTSPSQHGFASAGCQMTIFYGGQAHVFDNVHPNKADVIMALAGSNGGSWSTTYMSKTSEKPFTGENCTPSGKSNPGVDRLVLQPEVHGKSSVRVNSSHELSSGTHQEEMLKREPKAPHHAAGLCVEEKREV
ncbi:hypothetical protein ACH5RR_039530 [Cinchona calisaya]|uniref:Protein TIFY n=1 Tax=Cinchona calisaya TaxID=153742 RepID=A0ABD2Y1X6_9GENT